MKKFLIIVMFAAIALTSCRNGRVAEPAATDTLSVDSTLVADTLDAVADTLVVDSLVLDTVAE